MEKNLPMMLLLNLRKEGTVLSNMTVKHGRKLLLHWKELKKSKLSVTTSSLWTGIALSLLHHGQCFL